MKPIMYAFAPIVIIIAMVVRTTEETTASVTSVIHNGNGGPGYIGEITLKWRGQGPSTLEDTTVSPTGPCDCAITLDGPTISMHAGGATALPGGPPATFTEDGYTWSIWVLVDGLTHYIERQ